MHLPLSISNLPTKAFQEAEPIIKAGTVKFHGQIKSPRDFAKDSIHIIVTVPLPITGTEKVYKTLTQPDGKFSLDIAVELLTTSTTIVIETDQVQYLYFKLTSGMPNEFNLTQKKAGASFQKPPPSYIEKL